MNAKRILSSVLFVLAICSAMAQQRVDIILKDRSIMSCPLEDISYMEIVESALPGELDGVWYLGWRIGTTTKNYNGEEMLVFTAGNMKWVKKTSETNYALTYGESGIQPGATFTGLKEGSTTATKFTIFAIEDDLLVLKQSSLRYYFYKSKEAATNAPAISGYLSRQQYADGAKLWNSSIKGGDTHSSSTPMGKHFESYRAATEEDKAWLADPNNQPDLSWHELSGWQWTAKSITLYPMASSPTPADVNQHSIGDCCMCAVFASFAYNYPQWIKTIIEQNSSTQFTVHMFDPKGNPVDVVVDNKLMCNSSGGCGQVYGKNTKYDWATIMEKALMKWETRFKCNKIGGIGTEHAAPPFTGNGDSFSFDWGDKMYNSEYPLLVDYALSNGMIGVGGFHEDDVLMGELNTVTGHAFTVMYADEGADYAFVMRNPWGNEPSGSTSSNRTDGKLKIPFDHQKLRLVDFRFVFPGAQMAEYKKENLGGYVVPNFRATYEDMNPTDDMLRMYNVKNYVPVLPMEAEAEEMESETE